MTDIRVGHLTALHNSPVPMTVQEVFLNDQGDVEQVSCVYFVGGKLHYHTSNPDSFIGFGDYLTFSGGEFIEAYSDEEEEEEEGNDLDGEHATH